MHNKIVNRKYGEKQDKNNFFRKENGLAEGKYANANYNELSKIISSFFDEMDTSETQKFKFKMEKLGVQEEKERKKRDAEIEVNWLAEIKGKAELIQAAAI